MLVFCGGQSPLSNFNNSKFTVKGIQYDCNELLYVSGKAEFAKDPTPVTAVMASKTTQEIKKISNDLNKQINVKVWMDCQANKVMKEGVTAKFTQNPYLRQFLMNTDDKKN